MKKICLITFVAICQNLCVQGQPGNNAGQAETIRRQGDSRPKRDTTGFDRIIAWVESAGFSIRKSFDATSKDEQKPAVLLLNNDYENSAHYFTIDIGAKITELELLKHSKSLFLVYPKFEWHKDKPLAKDKQKNTLGYGANFEFIAKRMSGLFVTGSYEYKNDKIKETRINVVKGFLSLFGIKNFQPGALTRNENGDFIFRYYPYSGFEYYRNTTGGKLSASMWANRLFFELHPIPSFYRTYLQITFDYTYRVIMKDDLYKMGNLSYLSMGINIYPDGKGKIGIGLDYSKGEDPATNFVKTDKLALGLKIKL